MKDKPFIIKTNPSPDKEIWYKQECGGCPEEKSVIFFPWYVQYAHREIWIYVHSNDVEKIIPENIRVKAEKYWKEMEDSYKADKHYCG